MSFIYWPLGILWAYLLVTLVATGRLSKTIIFADDGPESSWMRWLRRLDRVSIWRHVWQREKRTSILRWALVSFMAVVLAVGIILVPSIRVTVSYIVPVIFLNSWLAISEISQRQRNWKPEPLPDIPHLAFEMMQFNERYAARSDETEEDTNRIYWALLLLFILSVIGLFLGWNHSWLFTLLGAVLACVYPLLIELLPS